MGLQWQTRLIIADRYETRRRGPLRHVDRAEPVINVIGDLRVLLECGHELPGDAATDSETDHEYQWHRCPHCPREPDGPGQIARSVDDLREANAEGLL